MYMKKFSSFIRAFSNVLLDNHELKLQCVIVSRPTEGNNGMRFYHWAMRQRRLVVPEVILMGSHVVIRAWEFISDSMYLVWRIMRSGNMASIRHLFTIMTSLIYSNYTTCWCCHSSPVIRELISCSYIHNYTTKSTRKGGKPHTNLYVYLTKQSDLCS